jgi:hypothetical protein
MSCGMAMGMCPLLEMLVCRPDMSLNVLSMVCINLMFFA